MTERIAPGDPRHDQALAEFAIEVGRPVESMLSPEHWDVTVAEGKPVVTINASGLRALLHSAPAQASEVDDHGSPVDPALAAQFALQLAGLADDVPAARALVVLTRQQLGPNTFSRTASEAFIVLLASVVKPLLDVAETFGVGLREGLGAIGRGRDPWLADRE